MPGKNVPQSRRERSVTWEDPRAQVEALLRLSGREFLTSIRDGRLPPSPVAAVLGYHVNEVGDGLATVTLSVGEHVCNPLGVVHGGVLCTLLDTAMACAVHTRLGVGQTYMTLSMDVRFVRPVRLEVMSIRSEGRLIHLGRTVATAEATLSDARGVMHAHAASTFMINTGEGRSLRLARSISPG